MHKKTLFIMIILGWYTHMVSASNPVSIPHTFNNGQVADADEVNENFTELVDHLNGVKTTIEQQERPIGSIETSILSFAQFVAVTGDPSSFDPQTSKWAAADGRSVSGSAYANLVGQNNVPDLRGMFLRGLNEFESTEGARNDGFQDPDPDIDSQTRSVGSLQRNQLKEHAHVQNVCWGGTQDSGVNQVQGVRNATGCRDGGGPSSGMSPEGGSESRPNNIAVYYYIKIN